MSARESRRGEETFWGEAKLTIGNERPYISDHSHLQPFLLFHIVLENGHRRQLLPNRCHLMTSAGVTGKKPGG